MLVLLLFEAVGSAVLSGQSSALPRLLRRCAEDSADYSASSSQRPWARV